MCLTTVRQSLKLSMRNSANIHVVLTIKPRNPPAACHLSYPICQCQKLSTCCITLACFYSLYSSHMKTIKNLFQYTPGENAFVRWFSMSLNLKSRLYESLLLQLLLTLKNSFLQHPPTRLCTPSTGRSTGHSYAETRLTVSLEARFCYFCKAQALITTGKSSHPF